MVAKVHPPRLPRPYPHPIIDVGSIAGLHAHDHELHCYCAKCDRWVVLDLAAMIRDGHGERRLPITVRCQVYGRQGQLQVRPPTPTRGPIVRGCPEPVAFQRVALLELALPPTQRASERVWHARLG